MKRNSFCVLLLVALLLAASAAAVEVTVPSVLMLPDTLQGFRHDQLLYDGIIDQFGYKLAFHILWEHEWDEYSPLSYIDANYDEAELVYQEAELRLRFFSLDDLTDDPIVLQICDPIFRYGKDKAFAGYRTDIRLEKTEHLPWTEMTCTYDAESRLQQVDADVYQSGGWYRQYRFDAVQGIWLTGLHQKDDDVPEDRWSPSETAFSLPEISPLTIRLMEPLRLYADAPGNALQALEIPIKVNIAPDADADADGWMEGFQIEQTDIKTEVVYAPGTIQLGEQMVYSPEIVVPYMRGHSPLAKMYFEIDPRPFVTDWEEMARQYHLDVDAKASVVLSYSNIYSEDYLLPFDSMSVTFPGEDENCSTNFLLFVYPPDSKYYWLAEIKLIDPETGERFGFRKNGVDEWEHYIPYSELAPEEESTRSQEVSDYLDTSLLQPFAYSVLPTLSLWSGETN